MDKYKAVNTQQAINYTLASKQKILEMKKENAFFLYGTDEEHSFQLIAESKANKDGLTFKRGVKG